MRAEMIRVLVDFNDLSPDGRRVGIPDQTKIGYFLFHNGQRILVYEDGEFEVEVVLESERLDDGREVWFGVPDWSTERDISKPK